jgi:hypothetical protein
MHSSALWPPRPTTLEPSRRLGLRWSSRGDGVKFREFVGWAMGRCVCRGPLWVGGKVAAVVEAVGNSGPAR